MLYRIFWYSKGDGKRLEFASEEYIGKLCWTTVIVATIVFTAVIVTTIITIIVVSQKLYFYFFLFFLRLHYANKPALGYMN